MSAATTPTAATWPPTSWEEAPTDDATLYRWAVDLIGLRIDPADRPDDVSLVRWVTPDAWGQTQVDCLNEAGFPARVHQGGIGFPEVPEDQYKPMMVAAYTCMASYPTDPRMSIPWDRTRGKRQFDYLVGEAKPCLEGIGVPVQEPPTFDVWFTGYQRDEPHWSPFEGALNNVTKLSEALEKCPDIAPDLYPSDVRG